MRYYNFFNQHVQELKIINKAKGECKGLCPFHNDHNPSFFCNANRGGWYCFTCKIGGGIKNFADRLDIQLPENLKIDDVIYYTYRDARGNEIHQKRRYPQKKFAIYHKQNDDWVKGQGDVKPILYNLPNVLANEKVFVVEGEKDAETLIDLELVATTNMHGAKSWKSQYTESLREKIVYIFPDQDPDGQEHARIVSEALFGVAKEIRIVNVPKGKDVTEWIEQGATVHDILNLVEQTPILETTPKSSEKNNQSAECLNFISIGELMARPEIKEDFIVDGLLSVGGLSLIVAKPKVGKSTLARQLALAVATGADFLGRKTKQGTAFYLALEEREQDVRNHFKAMGSSGEESIMVCTDASSPELLQKLFASLRKDRPALLIIDTMIRVLKLKDLNDYAQTTSALGPIMNIAREVSTHVCLLHHASKKAQLDIDAALGSTAISATVDLVITLMREGGERVVQCEGRVDNPIEKSILNFDPETKTMQLGGRVEDLQVNELKQQILDHLTTVGEPITEAEIRDHVHGKTAHKNKALRLLRDAAQIKRAGGGKKGDPYLYAAFKNSSFPVPPLGEEPRNGNFTNESTAAFDEKIRKDEEEECRAIMESESGAYPGLSVEELYQLYLKGRAERKGRS